MKSKSDAMQWIPLWVDKWIFGTTRIELEPDERSVWIDLMAVAAKDHGYIRANVGVPYPSHQLAGLLCISEELLLRAIEKCVKVGKLAKCENGGGYLLVNWNEYQLTERHKRRFKPTIKEMSAKEDMVSENEDRIIEYIKKNREEDINEHFEVFWKFYPKKKNRGQAEKAWQRIKPTKELQECILNKIEKSKKSEDWIKDGGKYIPYPATWLNAKGWEDEETEIVPTDPQDKRMYEIEQLRRKKDGNSKPA